MSKNVGYQVYSLSFFMCNFVSLLQVISIYTKKKDKEYRKVIETT